MIKLALISLLLAGCSVKSDMREFGCKVECVKCERVTLDCKDAKERDTLETD